jgi:UDP-4-amino-4,6-dideoxy-N-acetyl-beta-L-altrosamine transaminase
LIPYGHQSIDDDDISEVVKVLKSEWITQGEESGKFENALCNYTGAKYGVVVNSGTSALDIAIQSLKIPEGSEVISTPFTFAASNNAILYNHLTPVFADIQKDTRNIDPESVRKKISPYTRAIMCVDYAGHPCDLDELHELANEHNLYFIEDACHALGAKYHGKKVGNIADLTIFSYHPTKAITTGEGGAVMTNDPILASSMLVLRNHGIQKLYTENGEPTWRSDMYALGRNYRMTDFQAALGSSQIKKLDSFIQRRNEIAKIYLKELTDVPFIDLPTTRENVLHAWHIFTILLKGVNRDEFYRYMYKSGINTQVHYIPTYRFGYYQWLYQYFYGDFPVTEDIFNNIITIPLYPAMSDNDIFTVISAIKHFQR